MIWLTSAAVHPSRTRNATDRARTGTRRAAATSASTVAKNSGRAIAASTTSTTTATTARTTTWPSEMPRNVPNSRPVRLSRKPPYRLTNSTPQARAKAWTVPMTADSWLRARPDGRAGHHGDDQGGSDAPGEVADRGADPEPDGAGRPRERHHGQGVPGEALAAQDHEPPDGPGDDGHDGAGP